MDNKISFKGEYPVTDIEWLETDGKGGYASSTVSLCNTRKYHGLYVVPVEGLEGRFLLLSGIEPVIEDGDSGCEFSNSQYPGEIHPDGYCYLESFSDYPFPSWKYRKGDCEFTLEILMTPENGLVVRMKNSSGKEKKYSLKLNLLFSLRNSHHLAKENSDADIRMRKTGSSYSFSCYDSFPGINISFSRETDFADTSYWIKDTEYLKELERGFDFREDRIMPGTFSSDFNTGDEIFMGVSIRNNEIISPSDFGKIYEEEKKNRQKERRKYSNEKNSLLRVLREKAGCFIIVNSSGLSSIVAGYPWFGEWGRDTMISLPGLTFYNGRTETGIEILRSYSNLIRNGLLPNTLSGTQGFESYNSVDASLLYVYAVQQLYRNVRGGRKAASEFREYIKGILDAFFDGSATDVSVSEDGLLTAGSENTQLTWMDAMVNNIPVTPRGGSPVDINALWYNALLFFVELSEFMKADIPAKYKSTADKIRSVFRERYWVESGGSSTYISQEASSEAYSSDKKRKISEGYLADTVSKSGKDFSVRPNMLWAVSLPFSPIGEAEKSSVVEVCREKLLTSSGLRTLSPDHPEFKGEYSGGGNERDSRYHQGTVWPWLFGIYTEASLRASDDKEKSAEEIKAFIDSFLEQHLFKEGAGFVSEVFDGMNPGRGKGTFAQAWSSAEIIRSYSLIDRIKRGESI